MRAESGDRKLVEDLLGACEPYIDPEAWGIRVVLQAALPYAWIDDGRTEIVVTYRALALGILAVGSDPEYRSSYQNTATWFVDWLRSRIPGRSIEGALRRAPDEIEPMLGRHAKGYRVIPSQTVSQLLETAADYAHRTVETPRAGLRHLFAAMMTNRQRPLAVAELGWQLDPENARDLARNLLAHVARSPGLGENMSAWEALFRQFMEEAPPNEGELEAPEPAFLISGFSADRTAEDQGDPLETEADVLAMARLICHEHADPPISIGVFGGWGSGKSTFMEALQRQVRALSDPNAAKVQASDAPSFVSPIVQIRFNAWQFADANLWASLTAEFFDQLRAGGFEGGGKRIHGRLIQDVNEHVRGLSKEAAARRAAVDLAESRLRDAQIRHDDAVRDKKDGVRQSLVSGLAEAYQRNKTDLERYGLIDSSGADRLRQFIAITRDGLTRTRRLRYITAILFAQWPLLLAVLILACTVAAAATVFAPDQPLAATIAGVLTAAAGALPLARRGFDVINAIVRQVGPLADRIAEAEKEGLEQVLETEVALRSAAEESEALRAVAERADRALARYVDPSARANPPRVLRYLLEDDPQTKAFEKEIGLIGRARRLFHALDEIVAENDANKERLRALREAHLPLTEAEKHEVAELEQTIDDGIPDRIILYIDDLDRCTHEQVYKVLQAVHLLLAFRLFVVVVAVDMAWVEAAVAANIEFAGRDAETEGNKEKARRQRAIEYLSKIFQLPFWLQPFSRTGDLRYEKFVRSLTGAGPRLSTAGSAEGHPLAHRREAAGETAPDAGAKVEPGQAEPRHPTVAGAPAEAAGDRQENAAEAIQRGLRTLQLTQEEEDFLVAPAIAALAAPDPRGVKRLVNVYKIVRTRLSETDERMILGDANLPPAYPLIALFAAVETGQPFEVADRMYCFLKNNPAAAAVSTVGLPQEMNAAIAAVITARNGVSVTAMEAFNVARVVRRYSFNRFH